MMIVDTCAWVAFFRGEKRAIGLRDAIIENRVLLHPWIYGELLLGGISAKSAMLLQSLRMTPVTDQEVVCDFIVKNSERIHGIGWVDVNILVSAIIEKHGVYTYDANLLYAAIDFNCAVG